jgi:dipeptidyl aminopeptidase/acylaminoacyl peptidase
MTSPRSRLACLALGLMPLLASCAGEADPSPPAPPSMAPSATPSASSTPEAPTTDVEDSILTMTPPDPVSLPALAQAEHRGDGLRLGQVRERTSAYTSYDATYRSDDLHISGVLNVPTGAGPFPAVVLAHGYIEPSVYVRGQGMTRERGFLAEQGYVAFHVDYRNHAESGVDPTSERNLDLGYAVDVVNAVDALRRSDDVPVDDDRIALMGRSMGGAVVHNALVIRPGLARAAIAWASNSTLETQVLTRWGSGSSAVATHGTPAENPQFWAGTSSRTYFDQITEPVLVIHGGRDDVCPPRWARATYRALRAAGVEAELAWYAREGHAFGPQFDAAMRDAVRFLRQRGV